MRSGPSSRDSARDPVVDGLDRVAKLLAVLVLEGRTKTDAILRLTEVGLSPNEIADLLGTTSNTVRVTVHQARKQAGATRRVRTSGKRTQ